MTWRTGGLSLLLVVGSVAPAWAVVAVDADAQLLNQSLTCGTPITFSHTVTGANTALVVSVATGPDPTLVFTATYNSVAMTAISHTVFGTTAQAWLLGLVAPTTGTNTVSVDCSGPTSAANTDVSAISFTGVDQTGGSTTFNGYASQAGSGASATTSVNVTSGSTSDLVLSVTASTTNDHTSLGAGQTLQWEDNTGAVNTAGSTKTGASGAVTMAHTWTGNGAADSQSVVGVNVTAVASASTTAGALINAPVLKGLVGGGLIQ